MANTTHQPTDPELYRFIGTLHAAGMSIDAAVQKGYEFALAEEQKQSTGLMERAAERLLTTTHQLGISLNQQRSYGSLAGSTTLRYE